MASSEYFDEALMSGRHTITIVLTIHRKVIVRAASDDVLVVRLPHT